MRILLDHCVNRALLNSFPGHSVSHAFDLGWSQLRNGELVRAANEHFEVMITVDKNMPHQTSLKGLSLKVVVLSVRSNFYEELEAAVRVALPQLSTLSDGFTRIGP